MHRVSHGGFRHTTNRKKTVQKNTKEIITKFLTGEASPGEQATLKQWISASEENKKEFETYSALWNKSKRLVLSRSIDVEALLKNTKNRIGEFQTKKRWLTYLQQAAAVLILAFSFSFLYNFFANKTTETTAEQTILQEVQAAYGTRTKLQLADGTNVWLNSGSTLRFPTSFKNTNERRVVLNGEGYFDVTQNESKPFVVNTEKLNIKVYGTRFNVSAYKGYNDMTVVLEEGKVALEKEYASGTKELMVMKPNDIIEYHSAENKLYHSSASNLKRYTSWKDGYIVFYGDHIYKVVETLERWYNVDFEIKDEALKNYSFTATFEGETLEQVLKLLSLSSPIAYKITPARKTSDNTYTTRKVTLSIKK